jgi:hypothetical protein
VLGKRKRHSESELRGVLKVLKLGISHDQADLEAWRAPGERRNRVEAHSRVRLGQLESVTRDKSLRVRVKVGREADQAGEGAFLEISQHTFDGFPRRSKRPLNESHVEERRRLTAVRYEQPVELEDLAQVASLDNQAPAFEVIHAAPGDSSRIHFDLRWFGASVWEVMSQLAD